MFLNYFKIAIRNLTRRKSYAAINILGLAMGIAVCLVIGKYIEFETSYDSFHFDGENIYRVNSSLYTDGRKDEWGGYDLGPALHDYFPEVTSFVRVHHNSSNVSVSHEGRKVKFQESNMLFVDSTFFRIFSFKLIRGNAATVLTEPYSIVITQSIARKYFGAGADPVGKVLSLGDGWVPGLYTISAVMEDVPPNSHISFDFVLPMRNLLQTDFYRNSHSRWDNFHTYLQLRGDADVTQMDGGIAGFIAGYRGTDGAINAQSALQFQNLLSIHYSPDLELPGSHRRTIYFFALVAAFVLAIAWINYINLSTARAMERAKEVGVKKAIGVHRSQLITQFFFESALINFIALVAAMGLAVVFLPWLNDVTGRSFQFDFTNVKLVSALVVVFLVGSFTSGVYPAMVLSSFRTIEVIKGKVMRGRTGFSLRNGLVGFQFACSLLLLIFTFVVYRQVMFMQSQEKGIETRGVAIIQGPDLTESKNPIGRMISFKEEIRQLPFVKGVATSFSVPGDGASLSTGIRKSGKRAEENRIGNVYWVDPEFITLYGIGIVAGRNWNPFAKTEMGSVIVNEEAVKIFQLGTNESALTTKIIIAEDTLPVLAVVKNHHWNSLKETFSPMIFRVEKASATQISVQLNGDVHQGLKMIEEKYKADFPDNPFTYYLLDDSYELKYRDEREFGKLFSMFSLLAVFIGCLGLWGLASFSTLYRLKEISIRKTLGASVQSIIYLLTSQFLKPLLIAGAVVLPLIVLGVQQWLEKFPYRITYSADLFLVPLSVLIIIALSVVSFQTVRAARTNPVNALKNE